MDARPQRQGKVEFIAQRWTIHASWPFALKSRVVSCDVARRRSNFFAFVRQTISMGHFRSRAGFREHGVRAAVHAEGLSLWEYLLRHRWRCCLLLRTRSRCPWFG